MLSILKSDFPQEIIRTNRKKTVSFRFEGEKLIIHAPKFITNIEINMMVLKRKKALLKLRDKSVANDQSKKSWQEGEEYEFCGKKYRLELSNEASKVLISENKLLCPNKEKLEIKSLIEDWYKFEAKRILSKYSFDLAQKTSLMPKRIHIKSMTSRWGSCSSRGSVNLNRNLIKLAKPHIEYVIIHELCHLQELNHSKDFWKLVAKFCPSYKNSVAHLKKKSYLLKEF